MEKLYLGVGQACITPDVGGQLYGYSPNIFSDCVADDLTVTAFWFEQGDTKALMLSVCVCLIQTELAGQIAAQIAKEFSIPRENILICATHTHSGPNTSGTVGWGDIDRDYCDKIFLPQILSAVRQAAAAPVPVELRAAVGESKVGINRRELRLDNLIVLGQSPWGIYDPRMTVLSFRDAQGNAVANLIHYGCHGTCAGSNTEITRDWSGVMVDAIAEKSGAITAFFNGPEGDVGPRLSNGKTVGDLSYVREQGQIAAQDALAIYDSLQPCQSCQLRTAARQVRIPLKPRISKEEAGKLLQIYADSTINCGAMIKAQAEEVLKGAPEKAYTGFTQTLIAIGDYIFTAFPYELFSEVGQRIDRAFADLHILSLSNTNGSEGYFVTEDAILRGGYEVNMYLYGHDQQYCENADHCLVLETLENIKSLAV